MLQVMRVNLEKDDEKIGAPVEAVENMPHSLILLFTRPYVDHTLCDPFKELMDGIPTLRVETDSFCHRYDVQAGHCFIKEYQYWNDKMHVAIGLLPDPLFALGTYWNDGNTDDLMGVVEHISELVADYAASHDVNSIYFPWNGMFLDNEALGPNQETRDSMYKALSRTTANIVSTKMPPSIATYHVLPMGFDIRKPNEVSCC